jgi:putrescine transport system ATP-binding protein
VALRPEKIHLSRSKPAGEGDFNTVAGTVKEMSYFGASRSTTAAGQRRAAEGEHGQHATPPHDEFTWGDAVWAHWSRSAHVVLTQ